MIKVEIDCWKLKDLFAQNRELYEKLYSYTENSFINKPPKYEAGEDGKIKNDNWQSLSFYINDLNSINLDLLNYCTFKPVGILEMMEGARINTDNVFQAVKKNQIMLPNNLMLEMKELIVETNACTDTINEHLKEGWQLIAVLPQHQQSRPDYILGRTFRENKSE